ncbi:hypothetical protein GEMRC1_001415 [Eukaryota sp. GEM-RC1]
MSIYSAQRPTVITVGNLQQASSFSAPLLNGTSRLESCKFLEDLQAYAAALQASEALSRPAAAEAEEDFESATESEGDNNEVVPAGRPAPPSRIVRSPMLQFCPDPSEVSVPPEMNSLIPVIRRFISPRLLSAIPLLCPEAEEDNEQLLAWIYSNSLIHDEALADRLLLKISMNPSIKESSMRLADYVLRFQDLKKQISHLIFKEDHFLSSFIKGITPSSVSSQLLLSTKSYLSPVNSLQQCNSPILLKNPVPNHQLPVEQLTDNPELNLALLDPLIPLLTSLALIARSRDMSTDCPDPSCRASRFHRPLSTPQYPAQQNRSPRPPARGNPPRSVPRDQPRSQPVHRRNQREPTINRRPNTRSSNQRQVNAVDTTLPAPEFVDHIPLCLPVDLGIDDSQSNSVNAISTHLTSDPCKLSHKNDFLKINLTINGVPTMGTIDTAAKTSCITQDIASNANMEISEKQIPIFLANQSRIYSPGLACGYLTFLFEGPAKKVHLKSTLPILPGKDQLLIGCDILTKLGLMDANGVYIKLDEEHRRFISAESAFDQFMTAPPEVFATNPSSPINSFKQHLEQKKTRIELPPVEKEALIDLLAEFSDVFSDLPHPDGIDCEPMRIPFADESKIVSPPPGTLAPKN